MQPKSADCLSCHNGNDAPNWTVAGTVFSDPNAPIAGVMPDAQVIVTDANQRVLTLTTNSAGNFYTAEALAAPLSVRIERGSFPDGDGFDADHRLVQLLPHHSGGRQRRARPALRALPGSRASRPGADSRD